MRSQCPAAGSASPPLPSIGRPCTPASSAVRPTARRTRGAGSAPVSWPLSAAPDPGAVDRPAQPCRQQPSARRRERVPRRRSAAKQPGRDNTVPAALVAIVARYTDGPTYAEHAERVHEVRDTADQLRAEALDLAEDDVAGPAVMALRTTSRFPSSCGSSQCSHHGRDLPDGCARSFDRSSSPAASHRLGRCRTDREQAPGDRRPGARRSISTNGQRLHGV